VTEVACVERGGRDGVGRCLPGGGRFPQTGARCRTFNYCLTLLIKQSKTIPVPGVAVRPPSRWDRLSLTYSRDLANLRVGSAYQSPYRYRPIMFSSMDESVGYGTSGYDEKW
jgi:hypothetical protein